MCDKLIQIAVDNQEYFSKVKNGSISCQLFKFLIETVEKVEILVKEIQGFAGSYDLDEQSPGNGYRSFVFVVEKAVNKLLQICENVKDNREKIFYRHSFYEKEIAAYSELLNSLMIIGCSLVENHKKTSDTCLFSEIGLYNNTIRKTMEAVNLESFYGRVFGFHFPKSCNLPLKYSAVLMSTYSEYFFSNENKILKFIRIPPNFFKYWFSDKLLSRRMVDIFENVEVNFGYNLMELSETNVYSVYQALTEPKIAVNEVILIQPEPLQHFSEKHKKLIEIPVPSSHVGEKAISCRLFSARYREGMKTKQSGNAEKSPGLIIHCHGGGWIGQSSKFHGSYLKDWAIKLDVPIISIDYSLAPEAPFPRALEEFFYIYCWALKNPELVGSTGENIVVVGDSAGGNLVTACVIKCIEMGIKKPAGLFNIYAVFLANYVTAPSRFMGLMDVVLTYSTYMRLFPAYSGYDNKAVVVENRKVPRSPMKGEDEIEIPLHHLFSPYYTPDDILCEFPKTVVLSTTLDACLDEGVEFAKKLRKANGNVKFETLDGLNHGFLNLSPVSGKCQRGSEACVSHLKDLLNLNKL